MTDGDNRIEELQNLAEGRSLHTPPVPFNGLLNEKELPVPVPVLQPTNLSSQHNGPGPLEQSDSGEITEEQPTTTEQPETDFSGLLREQESREAEVSRISNS